MTINLVKNERQALVIPEEALVKRGQKNFVYIADEKEGKVTAVEKEIEIGARRSGEIEVIDGLQENDQVINHGTLKIKNGTKIKVQAVETEKQTVSDMLEKKDVQNQGNVE